MFQAQIFNARTNLNFSIFPFFRLCLEANFRLWLQDCVAARKDLELKIRLLSAVSIGFRGLEAQLQLRLKSVRRRMFQVEIFSRDSGSHDFAFWPECGECFAPFSEKCSTWHATSTFSRKTASPPGKIWN